MTTSPGRVPGLREISRLGKFRTKIAGRNWLAATGRYRDLIFVAYRFACSSCHKLDLEKAIPNENEDPAWHYRRKALSSKLQFKIELTAIGFRGLL